MQSCANSEGKTPSSAVDVPGSGLTREPSGVLSTRSPLVSKKALSDVTLEEVQHEVKRLCCVLRFLVKEMGITDIIADLHGECACA